MERPALLARQSGHFLLWFHTRTCRSPAADESATGEDLRGGAGGTRARLRAWHLSAAAPPAACTFTDGSTFREGQL